MSQQISKKAPEGAKEIEEFFGVYLLYCTNPKYKGRTYIGYTVDPNRRIFQHNAGKHAGGAWRTSNRGPWEMVLITHGFPNDIAALRFEWSWQHPARSRRLNHLPPKKSKERSYDYALRILGSMLNTAPWSRLPLTVRWLNPDFYREFPPTLGPPLHMPIVHGPVKSVKAGGEVKKRKKKKDGTAEPIEIADIPEEELYCNICFKTVSRGEKMECLNPRCRTISHVICLSQSFLVGTDNILPVQGKCSTCDSILQWGDLVRKKNGCYANLLEGQLEDIDEDSS